MTPAHLAALSRAADRVSRLAKAEREQAEAARWQKRPALARDRERWSKLHADDAALLAGLRDSLASAATTTEPPSQQGETDHG